jgi:hypothetical protein
MALGRLRLPAIVFSLILVFPPPSKAFTTPLSEEAVREAYFLGQRNDNATAEFFVPYVRALPPPDKGAYIAEVEIYTPYGQIIENSRRRSMGYSAQQAEFDYRHGHDKIYVRVRIDFTDTYGALELYRSAKGDMEQSGDETPLPDFYRDFRVGLAQPSGPSREDQWIEPLHVILQPSYSANSGHYPFIPSDLGASSFIGGAGDGAYAYETANGFCYPTGWMTWLVFDAEDITSDEVTVEVITTDGQHVAVPFDLSRLR